MSLLDKGRETVQVYLEVETTDPDGNKFVTITDTPITTNARVAPAAQSGTSARRAESDHEGFTTEEMYRLRFPRNFPHVLGPQAQIEWRGERWSVFGFPYKYNGSRRVAHYEYTLRRS